ncbi:MULTISPECIES: cupredoxin domain-containing protein [Alphaproteobacteria]|jgi:uncharacterized cupredoxin-like copper-binding protein|uniref:cupredoxin domain-containing protein n=1 Tax=Alphaproteobacteria TaxID=28211 RepID=UPI00247872D5|nr:MULTISPECIES: cupredoxin domain-containing protein [Alphaproteobacteria]MDF1806785.1 cupredoxin domain-containing protein [Hyphomonas sp.]
MKFSRKRRGLVALALSTMLVSGMTQTTFAAGSHDGGHGDKKSEKSEIGYPGKASATTRSITVEMYDTYYKPEKLEIKEGETVRFVVVNKGELVHEFNIGTPKSHAEHQPQMMEMMEKGVLEIDRIRHDKMQHGEGGMSHDHANSALLEPGQSAEIVWTFDTEAKLEFACNVPGHYQSGMVGPIKLND